MATTDQGNRFSGDACKDTLCLALKVLEKKLGIIFKPYSLGLQVHTVVVMLVDNAVIAADRHNTTKSINEMICMFNELCAATRENS